MAPMTNQLSQKAEQGIMSRARVAIQSHEPNSLLHVLGEMSCIAEPALAYVFAPARIMRAA